MRLADSSKAAPVAWHAETPEEVEQRLNTSRSEGLSEQEAARRRIASGPNRIADTRRTTWQTVLVRQFTDVLIRILLAAAAVSALIGEIADAVTIVAIVVLNAILGFIQEWKAEQALQALRRMLSPVCRVIRSGESRSVPAESLVPGDLVVLGTGDRVPADLRLTDAVELRIDESVLTGESDSAAKQEDAVAPDSEPAERRSMAWMGTAVTSGRGNGIVTATGAESQFGRIAGMTAEIPTDRTPLQHKLAGLGRQLGIWAVAVSLLVVLAGLLRGQQLIPMVMTGISLAVAVIPEGLPAVVTITLAFGIRSMVKKKALLRRLQAAEALGAATVICTDKTGTLTQNQMTVQRIWLPSIPDQTAEASDSTESFGRMLEVTGVGYGPEGEFFLQGDPIEPQADSGLINLMESAVTCNHAAVGQDKDGWQADGEPTEAALITAALKAEVFANKVPEAAIEFPFSSDRKRMTVITSRPKTVAHVKGAPEVILRLCTTIGTPDIPLTESDRRNLTGILGQMADGGLRLLAVARRTLLPTEAGTDADGVERNLTLLGIFGIIDPPRPEVPEAVLRAQEAGIRLVMITGDAARTALAVAERIGMNATRAVEGRELASMSDSELLHALRDSVVFARTTPEHKLRIVTLLRSTGAVVGMTGDGVNDAPALKKADIGIAMGLRGTDVARGAADIVLTDDNFSSIINAIEEGRRQYDNIGKFVRYLLSSNTGEAVALLSGILIGGPLILLPVQILWMNLITDSLIALALGVEQPESDVMQRPPRDPRRPVLDRRAVAMIAAPGLYVGLMTLGLFLYVRSAGADISVARTMAFHGIIVVEWFNVLNFRTLRTPLLRAGLLTNPWMPAAIAATFCVQLAALYVPFLQRALHTVPLSPSQWLLIAAASLPVLLIGEVLKQKLFRHSPEQPDTAIPAN